MSDYDPSTGTGSTDPFGTDDGSWGVFDPTEIPGKLWGVVSHPTRLWDPDSNPPPGPEPTVATPLGSTDEILEQIMAMAEEMVAAGPQAVQPMSPYEAQQAALFPSGIPAEQGVEGGLSRYLPDSERYDTYRDPETGALKLPNGVTIDPDRGIEGVQYGPNSTAPGSFRWLRKAAAQWDEAKAEDWRRVLNQLGYGVAKSGKFDATLAQALDSYFRNKYFFGKETPADGSVGTRVGAREVATEAYDPIQMKQDIRVAFKAAVGDDPTEEELEALYKPMRRAVVQTIQKGATPQHAVLKSQEQFADQLIESPAAQTAQRRSDFQGLENTDLMDSFVSLGQLLS